MCKYAHIQNNEIYISWEPTRPAMVIFSYETKENITRKARFEVYGKSFHPIFNLEKKTTFKPKLTCA